VRISLSKVVNISIIQFPRSDCIVNPYTVPLVEKADIIIFLCLIQRVRFSCNFKGKPAIVHDSTPHLREKKRAKPTGSPFTTNHQMFQMFQMYTLSNHHCKSMIEGYKAEVIHFIHFINTMQKQKQFLTNSHSINQFCQSPSDAPNQAIDPRRSFFFRSATAFSLDSRFHLNSKISLFSLFSLFSFPFTASRKFEYFNFI